MTLPDRFLAKIELIPFSSCWHWTGRPNNKGYGTYSGSMAHRRAYEALKGQIPTGLEIDHLCRVRLCVNPLHLEAVTPKENVRRADAGWGKFNRKKTHCRKGHSYSGRNLILRFPPSQPNGKRVCKTCEKINKKKSYDTRKRN